MKVTDSLFCNPLGAGAAGKTKKTTVTKSRAKEPKHESNLCSQAARQSHALPRVLASNSKHRVQVTPSKRGKKPDPPDTDWQDKSPAERHRAMTWV